jgi:hypothetical protein
VEHTRDAAPVDEGAKAERQAAPLPAGRAGAVLALQRSIGNRAVLQILRETDPRLTYNQAAIDEGKGLFWTLFETADGRWKASYIFVRPKTF